MFLSSRGGSCYHILAARISVGISHEMPRRKVNLITLRANKRKRPDKKSGRKRSRIDDMNVISAVDAEPHQDVIDEDDCATTANATANQVDVCCACNLKKAPGSQSVKSKIDKMIACDKCNRWYHELCVRLKRTPKSYECNFCKI